MPKLPNRGCRIDDGEPQECVLDIAAPDLCLYAAEIRRRHECPWWREEELQSDSRSPKKRRRLSK